MASSRQELGTNQAASLGGFQRTASVAFSAALSYGGGGGNGSGSARLDRTLDDEVLAAVLRRSLLEERAGDGNGEVGYVSGGGGGGGGGGGNPNSSGGGGGDDDCPTAAEWEAIELVAIERQQARPSDSYLTLPGRMSCPNLHFFPPVFLNHRALAYAIASSPLLHSRKAHEDGCPICLEAFTASSGAQVHDDDARLPALCPLEMFALISGRHGL
jgi:hypothetical protein